MAGKEKAKCTTRMGDRHAALAGQATPRTEGDDYAFDALAQPARVGNYTQIFSEGWIILRHAGDGRQAGNVAKRKYQKLKKGIEVRKDVEFAIVANTACGRRRDALARLRCRRG